MKMTFDEDDHNNHEEILNKGQVEVRPFFEKNYMVTISIKF